MKNKFSGKNGISIEFITKKIKRESETSKKTGNRRKGKNSYKAGELSTSDRKHISIGLYILKRIICEGFNIQERKLLSGEQDVSKIQKEVRNYKVLMDDFIRRLSDGSRDEYELYKRMELLSDYSQITQAARDGVIVKREKRIENNQGEKKKVIYDTSMTPNEVIHILLDYEEQADELMHNKLDNYLGLGLGLAATIGTMVNVKKSENSREEKNIPLVTLGATAVGGLKLFKGVLEKDDIDKLWEIEDQEDRMEVELLENEQISSTAEKSAIRNIQNIAEKEKKLGRKVENKKVAFEMIVDLAIAIMSGAYINSKIQTKENGKIDGKSLASALISLQSAKGLTGYFMQFVQDVLHSKEKQERFKKTCKKVKEILNQMEEKVYPLQGARHSFDSIQITNFMGRFYPKKDYETGKTQYAKTIEVPEFSINRGEVVLLSGESGTGKSTFLRFLKRGDINNRRAIKLDNGEMVDNLGNEYISFKPTINLGDETNVLYQITGKSSISDLTEEEQNNLITMLRHLKFDSPNLLKELASKKFMEFSTGQQRRLALSKMFYRIDDGTSVIIVDEPVGNVEDSLIREQLEMIKKYAETRNVMLILTTHRLDLAEDLATKRYNINKDGVLEQVPIIKKENEVCL